MLETSPEIMSDSDWLEFCIEKRQQHKQEPIHSLT